MHIMVSVQDGGSCTCPSSPQCSALRRPVLHWCRRLPEYSQLLVLDGKKVHDVAMLDRAHRVSPPFRTPTPDTTSLAVLSQHMMRIQGEGPQKPRCSACAAAQPRVCVPYDSS